MGLKDRLGAAKRMLWSPLEVYLLERGSDTVVRAGQTATVVVDLEGEDDGSTERVEVTLRLNHNQRTWPLGEVPVAVGHHELQVTIPPDAPPTSRLTQYRLVGKSQRTKGTPSEGVSPVRVIGHPDHAYVPDGPVSSGGLIELDADVVSVGEAVSGRVRGGGKVEVGAVWDHIVGMEGKPNGVHRQDFHALAAVEGETFRVELPAGVPPSLHDGGTSFITWEVRTGDAWHRFTVLDPDGLAEVPEQKSAGLGDLFLY